MKYIYWPIFIPLTPLHLFGQSIFPADKPHSLVPSFLPPSPFVASLLQQPTILFLSSSLSSSFPCPFLSIASLLSLIDIHSLSEASVRLGHKSLRTLMKRSSSWYLPGESCPNPFSLIIPTAMPSYQPAFVIISLQHFMTLNK